MSSHSQVRAILKRDDFNKLKKMIDESPYDYLKKFDQKQTMGSSGDYILFGWDHVKWYFGPEDEFQTFITNCDEYQFVRLGEDLADIEEHYNLKEYDDEEITVFRYLIP